MFSRRAWFPSVVLLALVAGCDGENPVAPGGGAGPEASIPVPAGGPTVVMSGLDSPRGLAFGPDGALYVVEAGRDEIRGPCVPVARGQNCYSGTGAVTKLWKGTQSRVARGLPSVFNPGMGDVTGPHDISFQGLGNGLVTIGWGADPSARAGLGSYSAGFGHVVKLRPSGGWSPLADAAGFEEENNPAGGPVDSNPYGILAEPGVHYVTDAGGNDLLELHADGGLSVVAVLPSTPAPPPFGASEPVPTEVERGPDGSLYVSTLTGVPFLAGTAGIYRIGQGGTPELVAGGFKAITDFAFGPDGSLYVVEYDTAPIFFGAPGRLTRVAPDGSRSVVTADLTRPTGVVIGPDGVVYVSNRGNEVGVGEVLAFRP